MQQLLLMWSCAGLLHNQSLIQLLSFSYEARSGRRSQFTLCDDGMLGSHRAIKGKPRLQMRDT